MAHEINNPKAVLLLNLPILQTAFADAAAAARDSAERQARSPWPAFPYAEMREELPALLADCLESAGRIKRIVEDLKDFVRSEKEGFSETVDLREVAEAAVRLAGAAMRKATGRFRSRLRGRGLRR